MSELSVHSGAWLFSTIKLDADAEKTSRNIHTSSHTMMMKCWRRLDDQLLHLSQRHRHQFTSHLHFLSHHRLSCLAMPTDRSHRMAHLDDSLLPTTAITGYTTGDRSHRMAHLDGSLLPTTAITGYTTGDGSLRMAHLDDSLLPTTAITGYTTGIQKLSANPSFDHCHNSRNCGLFFRWCSCSSKFAKNKANSYYQAFLWKLLTILTAKNQFYSKKPVKSQKNNLTDLLLIFFFYLAGVGLPHFCVHACMLIPQLWDLNLSQILWWAPTVWDSGTISANMHGDRQCLFNRVTSYGRVWRKVAGKPGLGRGPLLGLLATCCRRPPPLPSTPPPKPPCKQSIYSFHSPAANLTPISMTQIKTTGIPLTFSSWHFLPSSLNWKTRCPDPQLRNCTLIRKNVSTEDASQVGDILPVPAWTRSQRCRQNPREPQGIVICCRQKQQLKITSKELAACEPLVSWHAEARKEALLFCRHTGHHGLFRCPNLSGVLKQGRRPFFSASLRGTVVCSDARAFLARWSKEGGPPFLPAYGAPRSVLMPTLLEDRLFQMHHFVCAQVRNCRPDSQRTGCVGCTTLCACVCGTAVLAHRRRGVSGAPLCALEDGTADLVHKRTGCVGCTTLRVCMCGTPDLAHRGQTMGLSQAHHFACRQVRNGIPGSQSTGYVRWPLCRWMDGSLLDSQICSAWG